MKFTSKEELARFAIEYYLSKGIKPVVKSEEVGEDLKVTASCFVTLYIKGELRGCIGNCEPFEPLYLNIIKNAIDASTVDFRFSPIGEDELADIKIEVSVLTPPQVYKPGDNNELLDFLGKEKPGVMLEAAGKRALYLPQVWESFQNPQEFLSSLCQKAGLPSAGWRTKEAKFWIFRTI